MNKTKLEVIRINEDVIATSGSSLCSHLSADNPNNGVGHIKVSSYSYPDFNGIGYLYWDGTFYILPGNPAVSSQSTNAGYGKINKSGWYYWDGSSYSYCENQTDDAHPYTIPNP